MLRGNVPARIDEKGRLKIPVPFKAELEQSYGDTFCITSLDGQYVRIYPSEEWSRIEEKLARNASFNKTRRKFLDRANYYGQMVQWDKQGRVLIPAVLREAAAMQGEVAVLGNQDHLDVWNREQFEHKLEHEPVTEADLREIATMV